MWHGLAAVMASFGFAILFNVHGKKLIVAALIGGAGGVCYHLLVDTGSSEVYALFVSSVMLALLSEMCARFMKCPVTTFLISALIPLVPGGGMYYTMLEVVRDNIDGAVVLGVDTIVQAGSIVIGCTLASSGVRMYYEIKKKLNFSK